MISSFREELESKLDELYPKAAKDGSRGQALVLFAYAVILHDKYIQEQDVMEVDEYNNMEKTNHFVHCGLPCTWCGLTANKILEEIKKRYD